MEIKIEDLGKRFQQGWIFRHYNHSFQSDAIYGISGRNGSGKSTFLKIVSGLLSPTEGKVLYTQNTVSIDRGDIYQHLNIAAPYTDLIEEYTLSEMIDFHSRFKPSTGLKSISEWVEVLELPQAKNRALIQFSSGMKQRVKLGLALYSDCKMLFLDEPTSNLDENAKDWFFYHLDKMRKDKLIFIASNEVDDFKFAKEVISL